MSSILGLSERDPFPVIQPEVSTPGEPALKRLLAALLSSIIPGSGQLLLGHVRAACLILAIFMAVLMLFWPVRLPEGYWGTIFLLWAMLCQSVFAVWNALRSSDEKHARANLWWLLLFIPLAFLGSFIDDNIAVRGAGFKPFVIPSSAMEKTLVIGDHILADMRYYRMHKPRDGEVVIFYRNNIWTIKRVIGVPGDTVFGKGGLIYVNGNLLDERYVQHTGQRFNRYMNDFGPITIPADQIFVMGDNRDVSYDSRQPQFGRVYLTELVGRPLYITRSPNRSRIGMMVR
jgi:signal peptidase I